MENHEGMGGSYIRNPDGTLSLVGRTLTVDEAAEATKAGEAIEHSAAGPVSPAPSGKKKSEV